MGKYEKVEKDNRLNELRHGVDCFIYSVRVPVAMKKAAKAQGLSIQDFIFKAVLKELEDDKDRKSRLLGG
jgi:hypothetical protein